MSATNRLERLTTIRGAAALLVLLFHCQDRVRGFDVRPWTGLVEKGYLAVDFFFVLSGFILAFTYAADFDRRRGNYPRFLAFRLARVYPVHLLTFAIVAAASLALHGFYENDAVRNSPGTFVLTTGLMNGWGIVQKPSWNVPSWSISAEWFAYLAFPLFVAASRFAARRWWLGLAGACAALGIVGWIAGAIVPPGLSVAGTIVVSRAAPSRPFDLTVDFGLVRIAFEFLAGVLLYRTYARLCRDHRWWAGPTVAVCAGALLIVLHASWRGHERLQDPIAVTLMGAIVLSLALDSRLIARMCEHRAGVYLGEVSFALYMIQNPVLMVYDGLLRLKVVPDSPGLLRASVIVLVVIAGVLLAASVIYELFERPLRQRLRALSNRVLSEVPPDAVTVGASAPQ